MGVINTNVIGYKLVANGTILDIYKDEDITVSNNITGIFDIGTLPADFSRTILVPGTQKNNLFFEHVYDISIVNPYLFSTNQKVPAYLDFDGIYLVSGYIQLNKVNVKEDIGIESYEVSLYGTVSSFARDINRYYLNDLTSLAKFNHTASIENISGSWHGGLFSGSIVYPLAEYGKKLEYTSGDLFNGMDDNEGALQVQDFKPAIRVKEVWDAIFETFGYTYSSSFFEQDFIKDMYMVCNYSLQYPIFSNITLEKYGTVKISAISGSTTTNVSLGSAGTITQFPWSNVQSDPQGFIGANSSYNLPITSSLRGALKLNLQVSGSKIGAPALYLKYWPTGSSSATAGTTALVNFNQYFYDWSQAMYSNNPAGGVNENVSITTEFNTSILNPGSYYFGIEWLNQYNSPYNNIALKLDPNGKPESYLQITEVANGADRRIMDIPANMPYGTQGIRLMDFIKGLQKKFNLIIYPNKTKPNEMIVETFNDWYNKGKVKDFNRYMNLNKSIEVIPANNFAVNKVTFTDKQDTDYVSVQFQRGTNRTYGASYYNDTQNFYSQGELKVETTFAADPLVKIAGTGVSGSISGYNPTPESYPYYMGAYGQNSPYNACTNTTYFPITVYADTCNVYDVGRFYSDNLLTVPYNGNYNYWKIVGPCTGGSYFSIFVDYQGYVGTMQECGGV
jgi:hypothetical protein